MTPTKPLTTLPHHKLQVYGLITEFVRLTASMHIGDAHLRQQARKSARSCVLNTSEGAARRSRADKSRMYGIALAELCEAAAAIEVAGILGTCRQEDVERALRLAVRIKDMLSRLVR